MQNTMDNSQIKRIETQINKKNSPSTSTGRDKRNVYFLLFSHFMADSFSHLNNSERSQPKNADKIKFII